MKEYKVGKKRQNNHRWHTDEVKLIIGFITMGIQYMKDSDSHCPGGLNINIVIQNELS